VTDGRRAIGILGGTFDPIHDAHLAIAQTVLETLDLDRILFIPAGSPVHKGDRLVTPSGHRLAMVELAISGNARFRASRIEIERGGPSYAIDTVQVIADHSRREGRPVPAFIMSAEALEGLQSWRDPQRLLATCRVVVVPRCGYRPPDQEWIAQQFPGQEASIELLDGPNLGHSGTDIRSRAASGRSIRYLVPPAVDEYIDRYRLYAPESWGRN
jgi:nicotinate-nucleotide adenylyltransferase